MLYQSLSEIDRISYVKNSDLYKTMNQKEDVSPQKSSLPNEPAKANLEPAKAAANVPAKDNQLADFFSSDVNSQIVQPRAVVVLRFARLISETVRPKKKPTSPSALEAGSEAARQKVRSKANLRRSNIPVVFNLASANSMT